MNCAHTNKQNTQKLLRKTIYQTTMRYICVVCEVVLYTVPLCNPHDRCVCDETAGTDIQLSQFGGRGTFSQILDPSISHTEIHSLLSHAKRLQRI